MPPRLTHLRMHYLQVIARLTDLDGPPSAAELARELRLTEATMSYHVTALTELGYLERRGPRGRLQLTEKAHPLIHRGLPIYGSIAAGLPAFAHQDPDAYTPSLEELLGVRRGDFLLQIRGESMTGLGIMPGDYVVIRPAEEVIDGQVAAVLIPDEDAATLKRVYRKGKQVWLQSENAAMPTLKYPADAVRVQGRLIGKVGLFG
ncbi:transcriptional repressor LexA [Deinococcus sp. SL84]|uniref:transcriptional repressor LexA n=1 Tax=Deinococcus sp. SL84 TaxID=2994663 RepID=UPI00227458A0|nr:transcriptional repressor LexA [Deinococcus sp. SL84]MCY1704341.1 transcriptional repressor LexA [Deinococcus sp. SL84]